MLHFLQHGSELLRNNASNVNNHYSVLSLKARQGSDDLQSKETGVGYLELLNKLQRLGSFLLGWVGGGARGLSPCQSVYMMSSLVFVGSLGHFYVLSKLGSQIGGLDGLIEENGMPWWYS